MKHTQGEWYIEDRFTKESCELNCVYSNINGRVLIADLTRSFYVLNENKEEAQANAKLIAAAPDLLENLQRLIERMEENDLGHMSAVVRAKAAINKASK